MKIEDPAFDYDAAGIDYSAVRREDPHIARQIGAALGDARTILNVGAGAGSYEPRDRYLVALEPSAAMRGQRLANGKPPALAGSSDSIPFDDDAFDAAMALLTVHHWPDLRRGIDELRRVSRRTIVIMTFDPAALDDFWNAQYFPEVVAVERQRYPDIERLRDLLGEKEPGGATVDVIPVAIPLDCRDGFQEAFYGRPEAFLRPEVRAAQSAWGFIDRETELRIVKRLADDLATGRWDERYGAHRQLPSFTGALRLVVLNRSSA